MFRTVDQDDRNSDSVQCEQERSIPDSIQHDIDVLASQFKDNTKAIWDDMLSCQQEWKASFQAQSKEQLDALSQEYVLSTKTCRELGDKVKRLEVRVEWFEGQLKTASDKKDNAEYLLDEEKNKVKESENQKTELTQQMRELKTKLEDSLSLTGKQGRVIKILKDARTAEQARYEKVIEALKSQLFEQQELAKLDISEHDSMTELLTHDNEVLNREVDRLRVKLTAQEREQTSKESPVPVLEVVPGGV